MTESLSSQFDQFQRMLREAKVIAGFTGAGISTESGVPDFRSPNSPWMRNKPIPFDIYVESPEARREAWRRKFTMDDLYRDAQPSAGHRFIASLISSGRMPAVITQNIDGLHQASGIASDHIIELHGNGTYANCLSCKTRHELTWIRLILETTGEPPDCTCCGGILKSATISFGQAMPVEPMRQAQELTLAADLFVVMGSSLVVYPAAALPLIAKRNGARLVIINREPTDLDDEADLVIHDEIGLVTQSISLK